MPWCVINITTKPYQHLIIIPERIQWVYLIEKSRSCSSLGKPPPSSLQRPLWTTVFCGTPEISPDLDHFTSSGCRERLQSLDTTAGSIMPALLYFCKGLPQESLWWQMWQHGRAWHWAAIAQLGWSFATGATNFTCRPKDPQIQASSVLIKNQGALCTSLHHLTFCCSSSLMLRLSPWKAGGWCGHPEGKSLHPQQRQVVMNDSPKQHLKVWT